MAFLRKPNGEFNGSVGEGRDTVPGPAEVPTLSSFMTSDKTVVLSETLLRLRGISSEFTRVSEQYDEAWRAYITEEVTRSAPTATALLVDVDHHGHFFCGVLTRDGEVGRIEDLPHGERLLSLISEYFAVCLPQYGINLTNGEALTDDTDLTTLSS